jgi:hypothetical protein
VVGANSTRKGQPFDVFSFFKDALTQNADDTLDSETRR